MVLKEVFIQQLPIRRRKMMGLFITIDNFSFYFVKIRRKREWMERKQVFWNKSSLKQKNLSVS